MKKYGVLFTSILFSLIIFNPAVYGQEMPPRPVSAYFIQNLSFGAFYQGNAGGTVTVTPYGARYSSGDIILMSLDPFFPSLFELDGNPGTIIHILNGPDSILTGSNGGSLTLHIGDSYPASPIILNVAPPGRTQVLIGGTLIVGNPLASPPGHYTGSFSIMFIQE